MGALQRFQTIMAVFFLLCAAVSLWRILAFDGRDIWYVPCVLGCAAGAMGLEVVRERRKESAKKE